MGNRFLWTNHISLAGGDIMAKKKELEFIDVTDFVAQETLIDNVKSAMDTKNEYLGESMRKCVEKTLISVDGCTVRFVFADNTTLYPLDEGETTKLIDGKLCVDMRSYDD